MLLAVEMSGTVKLTQTNVAVEHVQDAQALLQLVPTAFTVTPLRHLRTTVTHVVRCHDGTCQQGEREMRKVRYRRYRI